MSGSSDQSFGIVPVQFSDAGRQYLLIQHHAGHWAFPKGHAEGDESPIDAAKREFTEETGIWDFDVWPEPSFSESYTFRKKSGRLVHKTVTYFIAVVHDPTVWPQAEEVADYAWGPYAQTHQRATFDEARTLLDEIETHLNTASSQAR
jgi:8-oxo-dGTP pyrophosphatase MutT (NUDIX family)